MLYKTKFTENSERFIKEQMNNGTQTPITNGRSWRDREKTNFLMAAKKNYRLGAL